MTRPAAGRRASSMRLAVCLAVLLAPSLGAQTDRAPKHSRVDRLEQWASALERHQPGALDDALRVLDSWTASDIAELQITFNSLLQLIRDPTTRVFRRPLPPGARVVQVFYAPSELRRMQLVAARLAPLGDNHVLKRAAMLHTDSVVLGLRADSTGAARRSDLFVFHFNDGQQVNQEEALGHWDMARFMLDRVQPGKDDIKPDPAGDEWVRRWYRTAFAYMLSRQYYAVGLAKRGVEIFRDDFELLFLDGVMHETLASPFVQEAFRGADYYVRTSVGLSSRKSELNTAEDRLRRVVKLRPDLAEARLHLGRVLAELDRHKDAVPELSQALASLQNKTLLYYGHLFAGRSHAALGDASGARAAFERAAALQPAAQSPLLALSQLAYSRGNAAEAAALLARVADLPSLDGDDPWWTYNTSVGRFFPGSRQNIVDTLRAEMPK